MRYSETVHQKAYQLFLQGYACQQISETCHVPLPTIYLWQRRWREKLSGQTLKALPLEDAGTLLLTTQALRRELEEFSVRQFFSTPGVPYNNAVIESFFHPEERRIPPVFL